MGRAHKKTLQTPTPTASRLRRGAQNEAPPNEEADELDVAAAKLNNTVMSPGSEEVASTNAPGIELAQLSGESPWMKKKQETPKFRSPVFALYARRASLDTSTGMGHFSQQPEQSSGPDSISSLRQALQSWQPEGLPRV